MAIALVVFVVVIVGAVARHLFRVQSDDLALVGASSTLQTSTTTPPYVTIRSQSFHVDLADSMLSQSQGLSGRPSLPEDNGMLFMFRVPFSYGFWMKDMQFPIDIVWVRKGHITGFAENAEPELRKSMFRLKQYYPSGAIDQALEVNAGTVKKYGFAVGDEVQLVRS